MAFPSSPPGERTLRALLAFTWLPALILASVAGPVAGNLACLISIMPICFTLFSSLGYLFVNRQSKNGNIGFSASVNKRPLLPYVVWSVLDLLVAVTYLGTLIPTWVRRTWWPSRSETMLETYATCFPLLHMMVHFYFVAFRLFAFIGHRVSSWKPRTCPNCGHAAGCSSGPSMATRSDDRGARYSLLGDHAYNDADEPGEIGAGPSEGRPSEERQSEDIPGEDHGLLKV